MTKKTIQIFICLLGCLIPHCFYASANNNSAKHDTTQALLLFEKAMDSDKKWLYTNCIEAYSFCQQALKKHTQPEIRNVLLSCLAGVCNDLGLELKQKSKPDSAFYFYQLSFQSLSEIYTRIKNKDLENKMATTQNNIGRLYFDLGDVKKALYYFNTSLSMREKNKDTLGIAEAYNNLAALYRSQNEGERSLFYNEKSLALRRQLKYDYGIGQSLNNIGAYYSANGDFTKALQYLNESYFYRKRSNDISGIANSLNNIGNVFLKTSRYDSALQYFNEAYKITTEIKDLKGINSSQYNLANVYYEMGRVEQAIPYGEDCFRSASDLKFPEAIRKASLIMYKIYRAKKNGEKALFYYEKYIAMRDSISNEENKKASIKSQLKYEYDKKAAADSVKSAEEKKVIEAKLKQEKTQRFALYGGLLLVVVFALFMVNRFRITNKQKKLIEEQKTIVEKQKLIVEEKQNEVLDSIRYAQKIQQALITNDRYIQRNLEKLKKQ